jgi:hypothetical protein
MLAAAMLAAAGCGGSGKPDYCADRNQLESSIDELGSKAVSGDVTELKPQLQRVRDNADQLVASAKSDFPSETSAIRSSVNRLRDSVDALPSSPSTSQVATVAGDAADVVTSVKRFSDATSDTCD